jgi:ATP-binding cassette subfamily B protein
MFYAILGPLGKLFETIFELIIPLITASIIDNDIQKQDNEILIRHIAYIAVLTVFGLIAALVCQYFSAKASYGFGENLRADLFRKINNFTYEEIDRFGTSTLTTRLTVDTLAVVSGLNYVLRLISRTPFLVVGSIIACCLIDTKLSLIFIACSILLCIVVYIITKWALGVYRKIQGKLDKITGLVRENVTGTRTVRAFGKQDFESEKFSEKAENYSQTVIDVIKFDTLITPLSFFILNLGTIFVLYFGAVNINIGHLTQGELSSLLNYLSLILIVILQIVNLMPILTLALASRKRLFEILDSENSESDEGLTEIIPFEKNNVSESTSRKKIIEFKSVSKKFGENSEYIFENINLEIFEGECVGITGGIGSGKSTLMKLLLKQYDFDGEILFYDKDIRKYSKKFLRDYIGYVQQKSVVFNGTVAENIRIANPRLTDDEIKKYLALAQFPDIDIDREITQNTLSGGQKQRISLARIFSREPKILILDDSSSALDIETEKMLLTSLKSTGKTIFFISQRENSLKNFCDKVLPL